MNKVQIITLVDILTRWSVYMYLWNNIDFQAVYKSSDIFALPNHDFSLIILANTCLKWQLHLCIVHIYQWVYFQYNNKENE